MPLGATATTHIMKPQIGRLPNGIDLSASVENEYLCLALMAAFGVPSASAVIADFGVHRTLVVERFDRRWTDSGQRLLRVPQEDCCQALSVPPARKYEADGGPGIGAILDLLKSSDQPGIDRRQFLKSQILFWLLAAIDGHAKNFSLFLLPGGGFRLTPVYDVLSIQPAVDAGQIGRNRAKLAMAVGDSRHYAVSEIVPRHFAQTTARSGFAARELRAIFDEILDAADGAVEAVLTSLPRGFPGGVADSIIGGLRARLHVLERDAGRRND